MSIIQPIQLMSHSYRMMMQHRFVEFIPETLEHNTVYVSIDYCTATHLCMCGCGNKVVTPISPDDWELTYNGESVTLYPSIGNWSFKCRSHYWIKRSEVVWAKSWSNEKVDNMRIEDSISRSRKLDSVVVDDFPEPQIETPLKSERKSLFKWFKQFF